MKALAGAALLVLVGCATATPEERAARLVARYGPLCGVSSVSQLIAMPEEEAARAAHCLKAHEQADKDRALVRGLDAFRSNEPRTDGRCLTDCLARYSPAYCQKRCSY